MKMCYINPQVCTLKKKLKNIIRHLTNYNQIKKKTRSINLKPWNVF